MIFSRGAFAAHGAFALNTGNIFVGLDSANFPGGELRGNFLAATGSQTFTAPAAPRALAANALTAPSEIDAARFLTQATFGPTLATLSTLRARGLSGCDRRSARTVRDLRARRPPRPRPFRLDRRSARAARDLRAHRPPRPRPFRL